MEKRRVIKSPSKCEKVRQRKQEARIIKKKDEMTFPIQFQFLNSESEESSA